MATIKAPFNFVPVSEKVFFPDWADKISQDIPFEDGESGVIELKITAESPIFVRNGHTKEDAANGSDNYKSFNKINDRYFIPATSIKGAIRNVLEIMSFGKMRLDKSAMFAQREWGNSQLYTIKNPKEQANLHCGYLKRNGNKYEVVDSGKPYRIAMIRIDEKTNNQTLANEYKQSSPTEKLSDEQKTAAYKYNLLKNYDIFGINSFSEDAEYACEYQTNRVKFADNGNIRGRLVLTGSPDRYKFPRPTKLDPQAGKFYEFVFPENSEGTISFSEEEWKHFKFIYKDSQEWVRIKALIDSKEGIPVFFRKNENQIRDLGMAFLYKLPYENSPYDTLKNDHKKDGWKDKNGNKKIFEADLADCLFGFIDNENALKGRVQVSHAFSDTKVVPVNERIVTLGSPKASYYPLYIKQDTDQKGTVVQYATYNANGQISGWKRYMIRDKVWGTKTEYNPKLDSILLPLDDNTEFTFKIRYHNLRKTEVAALLSAITFHNTKDCRHQLGQGKPYGFGKIKIEITNIDENRLCDYLYEFEKVMEKHNAGWTNSAQFKELLTITSKPITDGNNSQFEYLKMSNTSAKNEFLTVKGGQKGKEIKEGLRSYSAIIGQTTNAISLYSARIQQEYADLIASAKSLKSEEKYKEAKTKLEKAQLLLLQGLTLEDDTLLSEINDILERQEKDAEAKRLTKEQMARDKEKVNAGLSFLEEKYEFGLNESNYKVTDFKVTKNKVDQWLKKADLKELPQEHWNILKVTIDRLRKKSDKKEAIDWANYDSNIWKTIQSYVGQSKAKQWFNELNNK